MHRTLWIAVACGALLVAVSMGVRQTFGIFLRPISANLGLGREVLSLAIALQNLLFGLAQPFVGALTDRFGTRRILLAGGGLYVVGLLATAVATSPLGFYLAVGVIIGLSLSATTFVVVFGALGKLVPPERRSLAFGIVTAGGSFGMFAFVPGAQGLLSNFGWQTSFGILAAVVAGIALLTFGLPHIAASHNEQAGGQSLGEALHEASGHWGYWLLNAGFFVCGFHVAFVATHLPAFLSDYNIPPAVAANALALIGLFNIFGSYCFGALGDRYRKKYVLSLIYLARGLTFVLFLIVPISSFSALVFSAVIGFLWLGTVPLTSGLVAQVFGSRYFATLYGIVFLSHQIGAFLGAWLGGVVYDRTGSYSNVWLAAIALSLIATALHWPIADRPVARLQCAPS